MSCKPLRISILLAISAALPAQDSDRVVADSPRARALDSLATKCARLGFSGSVLVAIDGEILLARGVGHADLGAATPSEANTANTLFELASVTEQFTAAAVCKLVE